MLKKTILITGVAGFICSHLCVYFVNKYTDCIFVGIDKMTYCSNMKNLDSIISNPRFTFIKADITDIDTMKYIFEKYTFDDILHLAAYTHVDTSFGNSIEFTKNNVLGTHYLLELAKVYHSKLFFHMSTDEVYGSTENESNEESTLCPTNPYAASKAAAEQFVQSYHKSFKMNTLIVRCNNVYGTKQHPEKVIPRFIMRLLSGKKCQIQGSGEQKRSFIHILDVCRAIDHVYTYGKYGEKYNIGAKTEISILEVLERILEQMNLTSQDKIEGVQDRDFNDIRYNINWEKLEKLGWKEEKDFNKELKNIILWHKENPDYWIKDDYIKSLI